MKKTLILILFTTLLFTSCAKDYTCECTATTVTKNGTSTSVTHSVITEKDKTKAATQCTNSKSDQIAPQYTLTNSCVLL